MFKAVNGRKRRRRNTDGIRFKRASQKTTSGHVISEGVKPEKPKKSYARFQNQKTGDVIVANYKLGPQIDERLTYEFGYNKKSFATHEEAEKAIEDLRQRMIALHGPKHQIGLGLKILIIIYIWDFIIF